MIDISIGSKLACVAFAIGASAPAWAAWWSTGTDVKSMCENHDHGTWINGNHGGTSGWCTLGDVYLSGTANNYIMNVRMDRSLYPDSPQTNICIGTWTTAYPQHAGSEFVCRSRLPH